MTTYNVTNSNDNGAGSLREALTLANANEGADTIVLMSDVTLSSAIAITDNVTIEGNKHLVTQTGTDRLFTIDDGNAEQDSQVNLSELRLTGGAPVETGGAIYSVENLAIADSELFGNATTKRGGAVYQEGASLDITNSYIHDNAIADGTTSAGGGVYIREGNLTVDNSNFERNAALAGGGIAVFFGATADVTSSQFSYNSGGGISIAINAELDLKNSFVDHNTMTIAGGGIGIQVESKANITNTVISNNTAPFGAGVQLTQDSEVKIIDSQITGNSAVNDGGGIDVYDNSTAIITDTVISNNTAQYGEGVASTDSTVTLTDVTFSGQVSDYEGDNIEVIETDTVITDEDLNLKGTKLADTLEGKTGNDTLEGFQGHDVLEGNEGNDLINGGKGKDELYGGQGNDTLFGGKGADLLNGGAGNDYLDGNKGFNKLFGGTGNDVFVIHDDGKTEWIKDFQIGEDTIGLADGMTFEDLDIVTGKQHTFLYYGEDRVGALLGTTVELDASNFVEV